jgi:hypothetical protein
MGLIRTLVFTGVALAVADGVLTVTTPDVHVKDGTLLSKYKNKYQHPQALYTNFELSFPVTAEILHKKNINLRDEYMKAYINNPLLKTQRSVVNIGPKPDETNENTKIQILGWTIQPDYEDVNPPYKVSQEVTSNKTKIIDQKKDEILIAYKQSGYNSLTDRVKSLQIVTDTNANLITLRLGSAIWGESTNGWWKYPVHCFYTRLLLITTRYILYSNLRKD